MLDIALSESKRLNNYIDNIMQMLKVESGSLALVISKQNNKAFINDIGQICSRLYTKADIEFINSKDEFEFECDEMLFKQVMLNLVDNAVKFSNGHSSKIYVSLSRKNNSECIFEVIDNGVGLIKTDLDSIFTVFHRLDKR